jgi:hypothetical protein
VNLRSVFAGCVGVLLISALAPFNDLVLNNTPMVGGAMPLGAVAVAALFGLTINGPLSRFCPAKAFSTAEMAVIFSMMLVASALPTRGLMQMWPASVVGVSHHVGGAKDFEPVFKLLQLPAWFWPQSGDGLSPTDPLVAWFVSQIPADASQQAVQGIAAGWLRTVLGWSVFFAAMASAVLGLSTIAARQWIQNERVAFPIAHVQLSLIAAPDRGRWFNETLRDRRFLIGLGIILAVRVLIGLNKYFPVYVPKVELQYNLRNMFVDPPFSYIDQWITLQVFYPLVIAMSFFIASRISFSLWFCVVLSQVPNLIMEPMSLSMAPHRSEVNLGALLAFAAMILYSGRHFYWANVRNLLKRVYTAGSAARPSRGAAWASVIGFGVAAGWLVHAGMPVWPAVLLVGSLLMIWLVMANVVAHSGVLVANTLATPHEWFGRGFTNPGGMANVNPGHVKTQFFAQLVGGMWAYNSDHLSVYATHASKIADDVTPTPGRRFMGAIVVALVIGFVVSLGSTLWCEYHHRMTADRSQTSPLNAEIVNGQPKWAMDHTLKTMRSGLQKGQTPSSTWPWVAGSAGITGAAAFLQLRSNAWPIHPIGLLMMYSFPMRRIWFSVFAGWLIKAILVKYGGASLFRKAEPFFIGVVVGEVLAAALFALLAALLWALGVEYHTMISLPSSQY